MPFLIKPIGKIKVDSESKFYIEIDREYRAGLTGLSGFSHINVIFWCDKCDTPEARSYLEIPKPYKNAPDKLGVFATRSPFRPNPLALTPALVLNTDQPNGLLQVAYIDADDNTPVIDIKPYTPCLDRLRESQTPAWCEHWPKFYEDSAFFDWAEEFNF